MWQLSACSVFPYLPWIPGAASLLFGLRVGWHQEWVVLAVAHHKKEANVPPSIPDWPLRRTRKIIFAANGTLSNDSECLFMDDAHHNWT